MHFLITCVRYIRVALAVLGCALITVVYIIRARRVGRLLKGDRFLEAAARLPAQWAGSNRWWLQLTLNCRTQVYGLNEELIQRMRAGPVFVLGNHPSMAELFWAIDFYGATIGHVLGIVAKEELRNTSLGKGMSAIGIGWFIPREKGSQAVAAIRQCAQEAIERFERFCAVIYVDGTKPTTQNIPVSNRRLNQRMHTQVRHQARELHGRFQTTCAPKVAGARATIEAARKAENGTVLYVSIRSPRHVADLNAFRAWFCSTWAYKVLFFIDPIWNRKLVGLMSFVYDLLRQAYALCSECVEIRVEELNIHAAGSVSYIGPAGPEEDLYIVPSVNDRNRFAEWLLRLAWRTDQWVAEKSNCARGPDRDQAQDDAKVSSL